MGYLRDDPPPKVQRRGEELARRDSQPWDPEMTRTGWTPRRARGALKLVVPRGD